MVQQLNLENSFGKTFSSFYAWQGYNFEDSILIQKDVLPTMYLLQFILKSMSQRDTKLGAEEITRDIPNVSEEA